MIYKNLNIYIKSFLLTGLGYSIKFFFDFIYNYSSSSYDELLNVENYVSIHQDMFTGSTTGIINEVFLLKPLSNYNLTNQKKNHYKTCGNCGLWVDFFFIFKAENMENATE